MFQKNELLYENPLSKPEDIESFRLEGDACITFPRGIMRLEQAYERDLDKGLHANFVLWCEQDFSDNICITYNFRPLTDAGLAMVWVSARGRDGQDLFSSELSPRAGDYSEYHHGDINALHASYYRRNPSETGFRTCNLRKSYGFDLVCQGGDPLPDARYVEKPFRICVVKAGADFVFSINDVVLFHWVDDGQQYGPILDGGKIGFRQMAGLIGEYSNLQVHLVRAT